MVLNIFKVTLLCFAEVENDYWGLCGQTTDNIYILQSAVTGQSLVLFIKMFYFLRIFVLLLAVLFIKYDILLYTLLNFIFQNSLAIIIQMPTDFYIAGVSLSIVA